MTREWRSIERPGYFGRRRDEIIAGYNREYGEGEWRLAWVSPMYTPGLLFGDACAFYYQASYLAWFHQHPEALDFVCSFGNVIDNALTNIDSGCDYEKQEAYSTHIQDIAIRNVVRLSGRTFDAKSNAILVVRGPESDGYQFGPGNIPFIRPEHITQKSLAPKWANPGSVEDFWQSNKWLQITVAAWSRVATKPGGVDDGL